MPVFFPSSDRYSPLEKLIRFMALIAIFGVVIWAFWKNNERTLDELEARRAISGAKDVLSQEQYQFVRGFASSLKERYGLEFKLRITPEPVQQPELDPKTVFIGISPENEQVVVEFPPLLARALGDDYLNQLRDEYFRDFWQQNEWKNALVMALASIWERLTQMDGGGDG